MTATVAKATDNLLPTGLLIGGEWRQESAAGSMAHVNPATGRVQKEFAIAGAAEVDAAVAAAKEGLASFRRWSPIERRNLMLRIASLVTEHSEQFATIATLECGMIRPVASAMAPKLAAWFEYYAGWTDKLTGDVIPSLPGFTYTRPEPVGVIAAILTWNGPIASIGYKVAPAIAAGCVVVLKPPELAPFGTTLFAQLCLEAGMPPGVLNLVPGGPEAGDALVRHPDIDKISFTGGPATARAIQAACAASLTPLVMELGGKSPHLVFEDADLDRAAASAVAGITSLSGQICVAPSRLLVQSSVYDDVVDKVTGNLCRINVGDPFDPATQMGPIISEGARDRILAVIERARQAGDGTLLVGGDRLNGGSLANGFYMAAAAFGDVDNASTLAQEEIFGPVLAISRFDQENEAIALANDTPFGLAAYLHTRDVSRVHRVAAQLDAGNVAVNGGTAVGGPFAPFGGFKDSGFGKEGGLQGLLEYTRIKNVNISIDEG